MREQIFSAVSLVVLQLRHPVLKSAATGLQTVRCRHACRANDHRCVHSETHHSCPDPHLLHRRWLLMITFEPYPVRASAHCPRVMLRYHVGDVDARSIAASVASANSRNSDSLMLDCRHAIHCNDTRRHGGICALGVRSKRAVDVATAARRTAIQSTGETGGSSVSRRTGHFRTEMTPALPASEGFSYREHRLHCEDVALDSLAQRYGTPLYVYSRSAIEDAYSAYASALTSRSALVCYAVKANSNLAVLDVLARCGAGFDIVSGGELARVRAAGGDASKVVFSGVGKSEAEIEAAMKAGVACFNVESSPELDRIDATARRLQRRARIALRVNPDIDARTHPYISTGLQEQQVRSSRMRKPWRYAGRRKKPALDLGRARLPHRLADHGDRAVC